MPDLNDLRDLGNATEDAATTYVFLSGADMDPSAIRSAYPDALFVARARVASRQGEVNPHFGHGLIPSGRGEIWGIVIETPTAHRSDRQREATTDDGRALTANLAGDRFVMGDPAAVLKAAHYWELFPGYVTLIAKIAHPLGIEKTSQPAS